MSKDSRQGGKYTGNHTTLSHAAALVCDVVHECEYVRAISPGVLKSGLRPAQGRRRVKIIEDTSRLLLKVRDNISTQEIHVYTTNKKKAVEAIEKGVSDLNMKVSFEKK